MTSEGGAPPASGGSKSVEVTGAAGGGHGGSGGVGGGGGESPASSVPASTSSPQTSHPVPENTQTSGFKDLGASASREALSPSRVSADSAVASEAPLSVPAPVTTPSGTVTCTASPKETSKASPKEFCGTGPKECAGARPKERPSPASSTPRSPYKTDTASAASPTSMLDQQGSFHSPSEVSLSPSGAGDGNESTPRRYSGSTEDEGERGRHASLGHHWHLPFRKKITIVEAASPPKSVSFVDQVECGPPARAPGEHSEHQKEHHRSIGHAISHSSLGRAVSHSSIGHAVSQLFKKGHHSPPGSEGDSSSPAAAEGGAEGGSPSPHHSIGHVVAEFFKKGLHHTPPEVEVGRSSTPPLEIGEDVVSSLPSGPDEADVRSGMSGSPAATPTKSPHDHHHHEHHSIASVGHAVAKAFKKLNTSIVGSPGKPPRWKTWRRGGDAADPKTRRYRRRSLPGRRLSESAATTTSYEVAVLSLLRRRRSASRSPDRRARSPPRDRDAALQRLRRHALRRHRAADFLNFRRWRRSCPDLSTATPVELERVQPPIRHVVMRRAIVDELERIVLCYPGDKLVQHIQLFEWAGVNKDDESQIYIKFFKFHKCYDLIPTSAKLVVFDTQLLVKKAFFALVYNGVRAAPLWDSSKQQYVGMLTITDFIRILQMYYRNSDERIEELEEHKLDTWRTVLESDSKPLIYIEPEASLFDAITTLLQNKIHRLPVIDPVSGDVLYIITHKRILRFLCLYLHNLPRPSLLNRTLGELRIGTYEKIETARPGTPVIEALTKFVERRVSALPIVDADNKLTHIYAKFDVINLAAEKTYNNLDVPLMTANSHRSENKVEACRLSDTLLQVLEKIVHAEVHRLVITDDDQHVIGIISLSDILDALVIRPHEYNTMAESNSGSEPAGDDEPHMIVEEEPGDEEDPVAAAAGIGRLNLSDPGHKDG